MLMAPHMPRSLWPEAIAYAADTLNVTASSVLPDGAIPLELLTDKKAYSSHLVEWGSEAYVHIPKAQQEGKFSQRAWKGYLVGYEGRHGYIFRVYLPAKRKVIRARDVRIHETVRAEAEAESASDIYELSFERPADLDLDDAAAPEGVIRTLRRIDMADTAPSDQPPEVLPEVLEEDQSDSDPHESNSDIESHSQPDAEPDIEPDAEPDAEQDMPTETRRSARANKGQKRLPEMDVNWQTEKRDRLAHNRLQKQQMQANFIPVFYTYKIPSSHEEAMSLPDADK